MTHDDVQRWLDGYVEAWRANDAATIEALFTDDCAYRYHPYDPEPVVGAAAIAKDWLREPDEPGTWAAHYEPWAVDGDKAVAIGTSTYFDAEGRTENVFHNTYRLRFDDAGRCSEFTEAWVQVPKALLDRY